MSASEPNNLEISFRPGGFLCEFNTVCYFASYSLGAKCVRCLTHYWRVLLMCGLLLIGGGMGIVTHLGLLRSGLSRKSSFTFIFRRSLLSLGCRNFMKLNA